MNLSAFILLASVHLPANDYNNLTYGAGLELEVDTVSYAGFTYLNSFNKQSYAASVTKYYGNFGVGAVTATGYAYSISPKFSYTYRHLRVETSFPIGSLYGLDDVINFQLKFNLGELK